MSLVGILTERNNENYISQELKKKNLILKDVFYAFYKKNKIYIVRKEETKRENLNG